MKSIQHIVKQKLALFLTFLVTVVLVTGSAAQRHYPTHRRRSGVLRSAPAPVQPRFKGIWEPVNYPEDVYLDSVYFVSANEGWAAGAGHCCDSGGGIILHTADGGAHWELQAGDPHGSDENIQNLYFLDRRHGWAVQHNKILHTSDGKNWSVAGKFAENVPEDAYTFISPTRGIMVGGYSTEASKILLTTDGGRTWKQVFQCAVTLQVQGLTRSTGCQLKAITFPSTRVGYAVGGNGDGAAVVAKTEDGGASWKITFATTDLPQIFTAFFTSERTGYISVRDQRILATNDGGQSWHGLAGSAAGPLKFADPQVGWSCYKVNCSFTTDAGGHWVSREADWPARMWDYSVPRRDRAYVVGEHGMVYRYRVVPADYRAANIIEFALMPAYGQEVSSALARIKRDVQALQAKLGVAAAPAASNSGLQQSSLQASPSEQTQNQMAAAGTSSSGASGFSQDAAGGFAQDSSSSQGGGFVQDTNFSQDASVAPSATIQSCCATQFQSLQSDIGTLGQQVPTFSSKYRSVNLLFVAMNMFNDLVNKAHTIHNSFLAFKQAPNLQAAAAALQNISLGVDSTNQAVATNFEDLSASDAGGGFSAVNNMVGGGAMNGASNSGMAGDQQMQNQNNQQPQDQSSNNSMDQAAQKAKKKLKRIIHF